MSLARTIKRQLSNIDVSWGQRDESEPRSPRLARLSPNRLRLVTVAKSPVMSRRMTLSPSTTATNQEKRHLDLREVAVESAIATSNYQLCAHYKVVRLVHQCNSAFSLTSAFTSTGRFQSSSRQQSIPFRSQNIRRPIDSYSVVKR
jgi:hypothetical protein